MQSSVEVRCVNPESGVIHCSTNLAYNESILSACLCRPRTLSSTATILVVSTVNLKDESGYEKNRGRITLVKLVSESSTLVKPPHAFEVVREMILDAPGICMQTYTDNLLLIGVGHNVHAYQLIFSSEPSEVPEENGRSQYSLVKIAQSESLGSSIVSLSVKGNLIAVGCQFDSVTYLKFETEERVFRFLCHDIITIPIADIVLEGDCGECWCLDRNGHLQCLVPQSQAPLTVIDPATASHFTKVDCLHHRAFFSLGSAIALRLREGYFAQNSGALSTRQSYLRDKRHVGVHDPEQRLIVNRLVLCTLAGSIVVISRMERLDYELLREVEDELIRCGMAICSSLRPIQRKKQDAQLRCLQGDVLKVFCLLAESQQLQIVENIQTRKTYSRG